jgi:hypothetical protein
VPVETKGWRTVKGKAMQRKRKIETVDKICAIERNNKPPIIQNSGQGKKSHQLTKTNSTVVRWIGIFFDRKLSFNHHIYTKLASARRTLAAICSLIRHKIGLSPSVTCQLYQACVIPRSDYRAEIWWNKQWNLE